MKSSLFIIISLILVSCSSNRNPASEERTDTRTQMERASDMSPVLQSR